MVNEELVQAIKALTAKVESLRGELNLKVGKDEIIDQINISEEGSKINSDKILIEDASITNAQIAYIEAGKIIRNINNKSLT